MSSPSGPRLKLERAEKHLLELNERWNEFYMSRPYRVAVKDHANIYERSWILTEIAPVPQDVPLIIGDVLQNLRSALDHLVVLAITNETGRPPVKRLTSFPIGKTSTEFEPPTFGGRVDGLADAGKDIIQRVKPYKGGNEALWRLHSLNNIDKHNILVVASNALTGHTLPNSVEEKLLAGFRASNPGIDRVPDLKGASIPPKGTKFPLQKDTELLRLHISELKENMQFTFDIAFDQPGTEFHRLPVFGTVQNAHNAVLNIIDQFERAAVV